VIGDRERVAVLPVSGLELPLEVRWPDLVRSLLSANLSRCSVALVCIQGISSV